MNVTTHQEKEKNEEMKKDKQRAGEKKKRKQGPILKKLCAALLRSFRGQHSKKCRGVPGVTGTLRKANSHFDPIQTGSGTAPPRLGGC